MALNSESLKARWSSKLMAKGWDLDTIHSFMDVFLECGCEAIVEEIQANARANITAGSSAGQYPIL
ncbi:MAG: hypothetical protein ACRC0U_09905 [Vibrio sp.]